MARAAGTTGATGAPPAPSRDGLGLVLRGLGQTLITLGLVVLLFAVYEVWVTNYISEQKQKKVHTALQKQWKDGVDVLALPQGQLAKADGKGIANLYIPRFGLDYVKTVVEGVDVGDLEKGPGHYPASQLPGQKGNFAVAGHRVGKGEPFLNLDHLKPGDPVVVETATHWYVYCVLGAASQAAVCDPNAKGGSLSRPDVNGVPGRSIVTPSHGEVVLPVPDKLGIDPTQATTAYLTMTTCTPKFSATDRMIVHAVLDPAYAAGIQKTKDGSSYSSSVPPEITALYDLVGA
jgi:sortase A